MKAQADKTSVEHKRDGITVLIRPTVKDGVERFVLDYRVKGQRKLVWRSTLKDAKQAADDAIDKIVAGQSEVLQLTNSDVHVYLRARDAAAGLGRPIDDIVRDHAQLVELLAGRTTPIEACRDWLKRNAVDLPSKTILEATEECLHAARANGKGGVWVKQLEYVFKKLRRDLNTMVADITPGMVSRWLSGLNLEERTRRNCRDVIGYLCRFCVLRGYLHKGTDWLEGVQRYSARKLTEIEIYTPEELARLLAHAPDTMLPFIAIQGFAGLRHAEVARLDWSEVELSDAASDSFIEVKAPKSKTGERRLVPVQDNLRAWLLPHRKERGPVCKYANTSKEVLKVGAAAGVAWKHNGLRHSYCSYRLAQTSNAPQVADEAGNSPQMIRQHYLRRVKPAAAARWFSIAPAGDQTNVVQLSATT